ncbi:hypothetical protein KKG31_05610 [Patescibacteria group bacterium]|nr:hypothetical protein [Patescibacteria group bacterium]MBU1758583.1 hypothetical protein [Patescibacteria group bacterium]
MREKVKVVPQFSKSVTVQDKKLVKKIVEINLKGKMESYLKKIYARRMDAEVSLKYLITYHEESKKYDADFMLKYDGSQAIYKKEGFTILSDLVNHAFKRFKEKLSSE